MKGLNLKKGYIYWGKSRDRPANTQQISSQVPLFLSVGRLSVTVANDWQTTNPCYYVFLVVQAETWINAQLIIC
jgi:hypothetical protein